MGGWLGLVPSCAPGCIPTQGGPWLEAGLPFCPDPGESSLLLEVLKHKHTGEKRNPELTQHPHQHCGSNTCSSGPAQVCPSSGLSKPLLKVFKDAPSGDRPFWGVRWPGSHSSMWHSTPTTPSLCLCHLRKGPESPSSWRP